MSQKNSGTGGAAAGAAIGALVGGPLGAIIGAVVGGITAESNHSRNQSGTDADRIEKATNDMRSGWTGGCTNRSANE